MNISLMYWFLGFLVVGLLGGLIWFFYEKFKERDDPEDETLFVNFMPQYSHGYKTGVINKVIVGDKRIGIEFYPRDIDYIKHLKEKVEIQPELVFFEKDKVIQIPKGTWSSYRNEIWGLPPSSSDLPIFFKEHPLGKKIMEYIEGKSGEKDENEILRERNKNQQNMLLKTEGQGIAVDTINLMTESVKTIQEGIKKEMKNPFTPKHE